MNSLELIDKKEQLEKEYLSVIQNAEKEERKLHDGENAELERLKNEINEVDAEIRKIEESAKNEKEIRKINTNEIMEKKEIRLLSAINDIVNNRSMSQEVQDMTNDGLAEMRKAGLNAFGQIQIPFENRSILAGTATAGKEVVATDKFDILAPLRSKMVLADAGATFLTGLQGDVSIPAYSGSNAAWGAEGANTSDGKGTFSDVKLSPNRLSTYIDISKQFLLQDGVGAEEMLRNDIVKAISSKLESTILGTAAAVAGTSPGGLLNGVTADTTAINWKGVVDLENTIEAKNIDGNIMCIVSPSAKADLKTTEKAANTAKYLMEDNELNGYPVLSTSAVAGKGLIMGDFSEMVVGQWGSISLTIDTVTQAVAGKVRIIVDGYFDAKPRRADAFVKKVLKA